MDAFRHWLMSIIAGKRFAYWISDKAHSGISDLHSVAGGGAAIILADLARRTDAMEIRFTLDGYEVLVTPAQPPEEKRE